jgi:hypothetical protein
MAGKELHHRNAQPRRRVPSLRQQDITKQLRTTGKYIMLDLDSFDAVFGSVGKNHYPTHLVSQVQAAQDQLGDKLFFHQLLDTLHIQGK